MLNWYYSSLKFSDAELIQYLSPVGFGPSSNTCPKCPSQREQVTSTRLIPSVVSEVSVIFLSAIG